MTYCRPRSRRPCMSSLRERGLCLPALEARSCGAPVATSDTTPVREFLGNNAWVLDPPEPENLAELLGTSAQPVRATGQQAPRRAPFFHLGRPHMEAHSLCHSAVLSPRCMASEARQRAFPYHLLPCIEEAVSLPLLQIGDSTLADGT